MRGKLVHELQLLVRVRVWGWVRVMVEFGTSSAFREWVRVRVLVAWGPQALLLKQRSEGNVERSRAARQGFGLWFWSEGQKSKVT